MNNLQIAIVSSCFGSVFVLVCIWLLSQRYAMTNFLYVNEMRANYETEMLKLKDSMRRMEDRLNKCGDENFRLKRELETKKRELRRLKNG
jgi:hypothetical protein